MDDSDDTEDAKEQRNGAMRNAIRIPEIAEFPNGFPHLYLNLIFQGSPSEDRVVNAVAYGYVRLVENALFEYRSGKEVFEGYATPKGGWSFQAIGRFVSCFENCITSMHRAILFYRVLRRRNDPLAIALNETRPGFNADAIADRLRTMRHAIQHADDRLRNNEIEEGRPTALAPSGPAKEDSDHQGQEVRIFDRLTLGTEVIMFEELALWLREMAQKADLIASFVRPRENDGA